ncbi:MAG: TIGR03668 family PPOX class F420-dependent oxidoreductase [Armatimonadota bacterium]
MTSRLPAAVARFLRRQPVARLATADATGRPHVVPICFAVASATLYTVIDRKPKRVAAKELRRLRNVRENPRVAAVVDVYADNWSHLGFVLLEGRARILERGRVHAKALELLRQKYPQYQRMALNDRPVIAIRIHRVVRWGRVAPIPNGTRGHR